MIRVALVGLGSISAIHLPILQENPRVQLCAVCDCDIRKINSVPEVPFYTDYAEMLKMAKPDCVQLCIPHYLHYPMAKMAMEQGVHVFTEKPLALDSREAAEFAALEAKHPELHIGLCFQNRYNETTQTLKECLRNSGAIQSVKGLVLWSRPKSYYDAAPWRGRMAKAGGGVMNNQAIHTLDLMAFLCGKVRTVTGNVCQLLNYGIEVEDTATARLEFENGAVGTFFATVAHGENASVELEIVTEQARFLIQNDRLYRITEDRQSLIAENTKATGEKFYYGTSHAKIIDLFYEDMEKGTCLCPGVADGVYSLKLIDAIRRSSETGQTVLMESL